MPRDDGDDRHPPGEEAGTDAELVVIRILERFHEIVNAVECKQNAHDHAGIPFFDAFE